MDSTWRGVVLVLWFLACLYTGIGGLQYAELQIEKDRILRAQEKRAPDQDKPVKVGDTEFVNLETEIFMAKWTHAQRWFGWLYSLTEFAIFIIAGAAWGAVGGIATILKRVAIDGKSLKEINVVAYPAFCAIVALLLVCFLDVFPAALMESGADTRTTLRPTTVLLVCLFGGLVSEQLYNWIHARFLHIWTSKPDDQKKPDVGE